MIVISTFPLAAATYSVDTMNGHSYGLSGPPVGWMTSDYDGDGDRIDRHCLLDFPFAVCAALLIRQKAICAALS